MKFLFISEELIGGNIAYRLHREGHDVKLYIHEEGRRNNFENLVPKTTSWESELEWIGKQEGIIVFDDVTNGELQTKLRGEGYFVFGAGENGVLLETERSKAQELFDTLQYETYPIIDFVDIDDAIEHVRMNPRRYVIKKNDVTSNSVTYIGRVPDGSDVIDVLENYALNNKAYAAKVSLQEHIEGIEIAVARYFNGSDWVSPIEINIEHKPLMPGNIGITTSEMGTIAWYTTDESNILFKKTLERIKPHLQEINYRGVIDLNCIVNEKGVFPLEFTARFGSPIVHLQSEMLTSSWGELIAACARGDQYMSKWKEGYGIVVFLVSPPFPYRKFLEEYNPVGEKIYFTDSEGDLFEHVHFEDISYNIVHKSYTISDTRGYTLYVTASSDSFAQAQSLAYQRIQKIYFPKMMYRNDIGTQFLETDYQRLKNWGYIE